MADEKRQIGCGTVGLGLLVLSCLIFSGLLAIGRNGATGGSLSRPSTQVAPPRNPALKTFNVVIRNSYAESLFTVDVTIVGKPVDGGTGPIGKKFRVVERERVKGHDSTRRDGLFTIPRDASVKVAFVGTSLGEDRRFNVTVEPDPNHETLHLEYDWDMATAAFTISYGWR